MHDEKQTLVCSRTVHSSSVTTHMHKKTTYLFCLTLLLVNFFGFSQEIKRSDIIGKWKYSKKTKIEGMDLDSIKAPFEAWGIEVDLDNMPYYDFEFSESSYKEFQPEETISGLWELSENSAVIKVNIECPVDLIEDYRRQSTPMEEIDGKTYYSEPNMIQTSGIKNNKWTKQIANYLVEFQKE